MDDGSSICLLFLRLRRNARGAQLAGGARLSLLAMILALYCFMLGRCSRISAMIQGASSLDCIECLEFIGLFAFRE